MKIKQNGERPKQDPNKPDIMSPEYEKLKQVYIHLIYMILTGTDEIHEKSQKLVGMVYLIDYRVDLKVNGSKDLA